MKELVRAHDWSVSRLAVDATTGSVAGVCLCDVATAERPSRALDSVTQTKTEACQLLGGLIKQVMEGYDVFTALGVQKVLYLNLCSVEQR